MAKSSGIGQDVLPLPAGGGAMQSIDETFKTDLGTGTGFYSIPLKFPKGVNSFTPELSLKYSTGKGNSPFGLGWSMDFVNITRSTDRTIPSFDDANDIFLFAGRDLVPMGNNLYQPLIESEFSKITKTVQGWEIKTKNGNILRLGMSGDSRISFDDNGTNKIFGWFLNEMEDNNGNRITFQYQPGEGNIYLKQIDYSIYRVSFNYELRPDQFSNFRPGFELTTNLRCTSIQIDLLQPSVDPIKRYDLSYVQAPYSNVSLLESARLVALDQQNAVTPEISFPPVSFAYNHFDPLEKKLELFTSVATPPPSLLSSDITLLDFEGTGLQGVMEIADGSARFWPNKGSLQWGAPYKLKDIPLHVDLSDDRLLFADMEGNGTADLLLGDQQAGGYFPNVPGGEWGRKVSYRQSPNVAIGSSETRMVDLDGDNRADMMYSDGRSFYYYFNKGEKGWNEQPLVVKRKFAAEDQPDINISDPRLRMTDIVGDGRTHLVQIHSGRILYWPNLGNGKWGNVRRMTNSPRLPRNYDPARLFFADIDGSGATDLLYIDYDRVFVWINQSGHSFSDPIIINGTPPIANSSIVIADMKGSGTNGILWSYQDALRNKAAYRYLDICGGKKPYLLTSITTNTGVVTSIEHGSSIEFQKDKTDPRLDKKYFLPFVVPVIKKITIHDPSSQVTSISGFRYFNGHFDGKARQFLGFAKAERKEMGDDTIPVNRSVSYFNNTNLYLKALPVLTEIFADDNLINSNLPYKSEEITYEITTAGLAPDEREIKFVAKKSSSTRIFERTAEFNEVKKTFLYDAIGNIVEEVKETTFKNDQGSFEHQLLRITSEYAQNPAKWLMSFKCREVQADQNDQVLKETKCFYDGPAFTGLPFGQIEKGNLIRERQLAITEENAIGVYGAVPANMLSLGYVQENDPLIGNAFFVDRIGQKVDSFGNTIERKNPLGLTTSIVFDQFNINPIKIQFSNGHEVNIAYEYKYGSITSYVDQNNVESKYEFDSAGRLTGVYRHDDLPGQPYIQYQYKNDFPGRSQTTLTRSEKGGPQTKRVEYIDGINVKLQVRSEAENDQSIVSGKREFNTRGLVVREFQPYFSDSIDMSFDDQLDPQLSTLYKFDALGRSVSRLDHSGNEYKTEYALSSRMFYDPLDLNDVPVNNNFNTPKTEWINTEDKLVAIVERKKNEAYVTRYQYDVIGNRTEVEINGSLHTQNSFDNLDRRIRSVYRDAGTHTYIYDALGNLIERTDGKGSIVFNTYDEMSRLTQVRYGGNNGDLIEEYEYDAGDPGEFNTIGKLMKVKGLFGEVKFSYSRCGCLRSKTRNYPGLSTSLKTEYEQDNLKRFTKIKYPDGFETNISYNRGGLIDSIDGLINRIEYGATGRRTKVIYSNGVTTRYKYSKGNYWMRSIKTTSPGGAVKYQDLTYDYNELGMITRILDEADAPGHVANTKTFLYDELDQLIRSMGTNAAGLYVHNYEYDLLGNIKRYPEQYGAEKILHESTDHPYRITGVTNKPAEIFQYDDSGNIVKTKDCEMQYDARNQLSKVIHTNGDTAEYLYDHLGSRVVTKTTTNGNTSTTFNFDNIYTIEGNEKLKYIFDEDSQFALVREDQSGVVFHKDHLGSFTAETDLQSGALLKQQDYYAFGKTIHGVSLATPHDFSGKKHDSISDLIFFGGRYYIPSLGIFLTPDPYFLDQQPEKFFKTPGSLMLYSYVQNNPVNIIDPTGLWFGVDDAIAAGLGFVLGVGGYLVNVGMSGGDFSWSEMLYSGFLGAASLWLTYNLLPLAFAVAGGLAMLFGTSFCAALDEASMEDGVGAKLQGALSFAIKFARSPVFTTIGLLIGFVGIGFGAWGDVSWFKGGVIAFEHDAGAPEFQFSGVTLGGTVNIWHGNVDQRPFVHELYHSRQYTTFGDWFFPGWLLGGVYGMISGKLGGSTDWKSCFYAANPDKGYGNPLEAGAQSIVRGGGCS